MCTKEGAVNSSWRHQNKLHGGSIDSLPGVKKELLMLGGQRVNKLQLPHNFYLRTVKSLLCDWIMRQNKFIEELEAEFHLTSFVVEGQAVCSVSTSRR